ncbi:MAG TPA: hypothetical protein VI136_25235 [Verrucomicrobiae bacterium]
MRVALCSLPLLWCLFGAVTSPTSAQPATDTAAEVAYQSGLALDAGKGVPKNPAQAVEQYRKAATQGHVLAQLALGQRYYRGEGVTKDSAEAVKWFRKAAEAGNAKAQFNLAICLETGEGVTKSVPQAMRWYEKAANAGDAMAQFNLGINYWRGDGVAQDKTEGLKWFMLAADQGNPKAQLVVGRMYASGNGLPQNPTLARKMLQSATDQGNEQAKAELAKLDAANSTLDDPSGLASGYKPTNTADALFSGKTRQQIRDQKTTGATASDAGMTSASLVQAIDRASASKTSSVAGASGSTQDRSVGIPASAPTSAAPADSLLGGRSRKQVREQSAVMREATKAGQPDPKPSRANEPPPQAERPAPARAAISSQSELPTAATATPTAPSSEISEELAELGEFAEMERAITEASRQGADLPSVPSNDPCEPKVWTMRGAPWRVKPLQPAPSSSEKAPVQPLPKYTSSDYKAVVTRCMEGMRAVYGTMPVEQTAEFNLLWAPFFDSPSASLYVYFSQLLPLLDEYLRLNSVAAAILPSFEESLQLAALLSQAGDETGARSSLNATFLHVMTLKQNQEAMKTVVARIEAMGDPPNPLSEQCAQRGRHKKTMAALQPSGIEGEWIGQWHNLSEQYGPLRVPNVSAFRKSARMFSAEVGDYQTVPGNQFHAILTKCTEYDKPRPVGGNPNIFYPPGIVYYLYLFDHPWMDKMDVKTMGRVVNRLFLTQHACWMFRNNMLPPVLKQPDGSYVQRFREVNAYSNHYLDQILRLKAEGNDLTVDWIGILYKDEQETTEGDRVLFDPAGSVVYHLQARAKRAPARRAKDTPEGFELFPKLAFHPHVFARPLNTQYESKLLKELADKQAQEAARKELSLKDLNGGGLADTAQSTDVPAEDPQAILDSIAQRESAMKIIEANLERIQADIDRTREQVVKLPPGDKAGRKAAEDRIQALQDQIVGQNANLQGERDAVMSLKTGVYVHTRTAWDEREHQALVAKIEREVSQLSAETRMVNSLGRHAALIPGADGVETREWVQSKINEALKSEDRLGNLRKIGGVIQTKIEASALADQAKVTEQDILADQGLKVAQQVSETSDAMIMLGALFIPGAGQIALGYGIGTGFAQGGLAKGLENGVRGYFDSVDVIWSGVEGYYEKDEKGRIKGWSRAFESAGTTFIMNKMMEKLGGLLQGQGQTIVNRGTIGARPAVETGPARPRPPAPEVAHPDPARSQNAYQPVARTPSPGSAAAETRAPQSSANTAEVHPQGADPKPASPYPDIPPGHAAGKHTSNEPQFDAFKNPDERLDTDFAQFKEKHGDHPDPANPEFTKDMAQLQQDHGLQIKRRQMEARKAAKTREMEARIPPLARNPDGTVKPEDPAYKEVVDQWNKEMDAIDAEFNVGVPERMDTLKATIQELGLPPMTDKDNARIVMSGGEPKTIKSDIDMTALDMDSGHKLMLALKAKGYTVKEYGDRWVVTGFDLTVWKPPTTGPNPEARVAAMLAAKGHPVVEMKSGYWIKDTGAFIPKKTRTEKIGDSAHDARIAYDTERGSDKFPTPGGVHYTSKGDAGIHDPRGAVIANAKKAGEAGIGGEGETDFHVIGKSVDKAVEVANACGPEGQIAAPDFIKKAQAVRQHRTPEQAGVCTFGNPESVKQAEQRKFLQEAQGLMNRAYQKSSEASSKVEAERHRELERAVALGDKKKAVQIRQDLVLVRVANESALRSIAVMDPHFVNGMVGGHVEANARLDVSKVKLEPAPETPAAGPGTQTSGPTPRTYGYGWLWKDLQGEPETPTALPAPTIDRLPPEFKKLSDQCRKAAESIEARLESDMKNQGETTRQLQELKSALEVAARDPIQGQFQIRAATGYELPTVLRDIEQNVLLKDGKN